MPGITLFKITTTRGIELSQSLCRMTFHGSSGLALFRVRLRLSFLLFVAAIVGGILAPIPVKDIDLTGHFIAHLRTKPHSEIGLSRAGRDRSSCSLDTSVWSSDTASGDPEGSLRPVMRANLNP